MTREEAIHRLKNTAWLGTNKDREETEQAVDMAIEALSAEAVPQSEQYKKGFEDAKRAFLVEYARESKNMRKRNAQLEVMLNAYRAISADAVCKAHEEEHLNIINRIKELQYAVAKPNCQKCAIKELWQATEKEDLVAVVRCKDCKWYMLTDHYETEVCTNKQWDISMAVYPIISENDFCSYGERREE